MVTRFFSVVPPRVSVRILSAVLSFALCFSVLRIYEMLGDSENDMTGNDNSVSVGEQTDGIDTENENKDKTTEDGDITSVFNDNNAKEIGGQISASSAIMCNLTENAVIYRKNERLVVSAEAILPLVCSLLVMQSVEEGRVSPSDRAVCPASAVKLKHYGDTSSLISVGGSLTVSELLKCMFCASPQVFAYILAIHIFGSEQKFVEEINSYLQEIGIRETSFYSIAELDSQTTTVYDGTVILGEFLKNAILYEMLSSAEALVISASGSAWNMVTVCNAFYSECCTQAQAKVDGITAGYYFKIGTEQYVYTIFESEGSIYAAAVFGSSTAYADSLIMRARV